MNDKELQQAFLQFLAKKSGAKNQQELEKYVQSLGEDGLKQAYNEFTKVMQSQAQKAAHGAKLQYFRDLKHKCAEGEELVFYKKGGSVECGCKGKVMEKGGEVKKASTGTAIVDDFKKKKQKQQTTTQQTNNKPKESNNKPKERLNPTSTPKLPGGKYPTYWNAAEREAWERKYGSEANGTPERKKGGELKKAGAGCIAEFKSKRRFAKGGSLNGIPFIKLVQ